MPPKVDELKKVLCVHLYDDFSGSSKVMAQSIDALHRHGHSILTLVGSYGATGFIREFHPVVLFNYSFGGSKFRMLFSFAAAQFRLFLATCKYCRSWKPNVVYANTVLPAGAVIAAVLCRVPVVVHMHEVGLGTPTLFHMLIRVVHWGADRVICVSNYVAINLPLNREKMVVVYNALPQKDREMANRIAAQNLEIGPHQPFTVLMACSLKWYKGIDSFIEASRRLKNAGIRFKLVINCELQEFENFISSQYLPDNLELVRRPTSVYEHYRDAGLVVNLSHREACVESFGLTLLEAMACGIPVIAPQVGGCTELVRDGEGGWLIDSKDLDALCSRVTELASNGQAWAQASAAASSSSERFSDEGFARDLHKVIQCLL
ncbi:glycosyltransferase family 4 protein [Hydrogenophaga sp.]|uniref:glycosyltransferase family 4 protein n=1 Tax=Hydrogenophaga sp. TaxID=1904254 RepID=UPI00260FB153|nr:glycosyltransferase family 4 protein [Hydrogenophaga sp.]MDM7948218.1 glycosyltransferase family 4 protein [Hydrogenophaga sp.]